MKFWTILIILFKSALNLIASNSNEQDLQLAMRQIGHQVLRSVGDSTTRILPVKKNGNSYTISFEKPSLIDYDSIISISTQELKRIGINHFIAEIRGCDLGETFLIFAIKPNNNKNAPCSGREISNLCYDIVITIPEKKQSSYLLLISLFGLGLVFSLLYLFFKRKKEESITNMMENAKHEPDIDGVKIGRFVFNENKSSLYLEAQNISLTDKESRLLSLLFHKLNQSLSREELIQQIWGNDGVIVVSRNIDVLVSKLRKKLTEDPAIKIINVHGVGYKMELQ